MSALGDFFYGHTGFPGDDFEDFVSAEAALAAAHTGAGIEFDAVKGGVSLMDGLDDFGFGDGFTAADHMAVLGIFVDQFGEFLGAFFPDPDFFGDGGIVITFFGEGYAGAFEEILDVVADGG